MIFPNSQILATALLVGAAASFSLAIRERLQPRGIGPTGVTVSLFAILVFAILAIQYLRYSNHRGIRINQNRPTVGPCTAPGRLVSGTAMFSDPKLMSNEVWAGLATLIFWNDGVQEPSNLTPQGLVVTEACVTRPSEQAVVWYAPGGYGSKLSLSPSNACTNLCPGVRLPPHAELWCACSSANCLSDPVASCVLTGFVSAGEVTPAN